MDKTPSHMAEMLIKGSTMGIVDLNKRLNDYTEVDPKVTNLAEKLLSTEQSNVDELKMFL